MKCYKGRTDCSQSVNFFVCYSLIFIVIYIWSERWSFKGHDVLYNGKITYYWTKEMETEYSCEALTPIFQASQQNILEDSNKHSPRRKKNKGKGRLWVLQHCCLEAYCTLTRMSSFIHLQRRCTHQAAWETSASERRNYTWNLAGNP